MKPTLAEFIAIGKKAKRANLHIREPGFATLYVRYGRRILDHTVYYDVFDISSVEVEERLRGTGVFTRFVEKFLKDYPGVHIYVENAAPRLGLLLLRRLGFVRHEFNQDCFYKLSKESCLESTSTTGTPGTVAGSS